MMEIFAVRPPAFALSLCGSTPFSFRTTFIDNFVGYCVLNIPDHSPNVNAALSAWREKRRRSPVSSSRALTRIKLH